MFHYIMLFAGLLAASWVYKDAKQWGYTKLWIVIWSLGTLFTVYIFFPLYLILGRKPQLKAKPENKDTMENITIEADAKFSGVVIDCPMCGKQVNEEYNNCPHCGYTLKLYCEKCQYELERDWKVCPNCQTKTPQK